MSLINNSFKTFLISLLSFTLLLFSISCSNEDSMGGGGSINTYAGDWYDAKDNIKVMTVNSDGSITIDDETGAVKVTNITKKSDTNYVMQYDKSSVTVQYDVNFSSYNSGTIAVTTIYSGTTTPSGTINIVKK